MRDTWNVYFLKIAYAVAERATCNRLHVGCVLVDPGTRSILATGYNGSARGSDHCDDVGHDMVNGHCVRTAHAEANAIAQAAAQGVAVRGAFAYLTAYPCWGCAKLLLNAGVSRIVYAKAYRVDERVEAAAARVGAVLFHQDVDDPGTALLKAHDNWVFWQDAAENLEKKVLDLEARVRRLTPALAAMNEPELGYVPKVVVSEEAFSSIDDFLKK